MISAFISDVNGSQKRTTAISAFISDANERTEVSEYVDKREDVEAKPDSFCYSVHDLLIDRKRPMRVALLVARTSVSRRTSCTGKLRLILLSA